MTPPMQREWALMFVSVKPIFGTADQITDFMAVVVFFLIIFCHCPTAMVLTRGGVSCGDVLSKVPQLATCCCQQAPFWLTTFPVDVQFSFGKFFFS